MSILKLMTDEEREAEFQDWWKNFASNVDLFMPSYCGYWLRGVAYSERHDTWLVYETAHRTVADKDELILKQAWEKWNDASHGKVFHFPDRWFQWTKDDARRAYRFGERLWGEGWLSDGRTDATRYDTVIQMALLGEIRYG